MGKKERKNPTAAGPEGGICRLAELTRRRKPEVELPSLTRSLVGLLLTKKGQQPCFEPGENEDASRHFAPGAALAHGGPCRPSLPNGDLILAGLPPRKDIHAGAVSDYAQSVTLQLLFFNLH